VGVSRTYISLLAGAGVIGAVVTQVLSVWNYLPSETLTWSTWSETLLWINWGSWTFAGAIAGVLVGHTALVFKDPKQRLSPAVAVCVLGNMVAWLVFLAFGERVTEAEFARSAVERARLGAGIGGLSMMHDAPTVVACRWVGTFGAINFADRILALFAGPAIDFTQAVIVPDASSIVEGIIATPRESWRVAASAFLLSTTFWVAVGSVVNAGSRLRRRTNLTNERP
jgi:hypothetical protein